MQSDWRIRNAADAAMRGGRGEIQVLIYARGGHFTDDVFSPRPPRIVASAAFLLRQPGNQTIADSQ
jgi:hypothetical protein